MSVYYNENDPFAAAWLQELIKANVIAQGDVDDRSIKEVKADDLKKYTQCHFFAGIGVWAYALDRAGWGDRQVWTGSCPCQPFSAAGKKGGFKDDRHLWPEWFRLISESKPDVVFGEQIAAKDGLMWFDLVSTDLERSGYTVGATDLCSAGFGAPHIRQRLYFVGHAAKKGLSVRSGQKIHGEETCGQHKRPGDAGSVAASRLAEPDGGNARTEGLQRSGQHGQQPEDGGVVRSATSGFWREADWIPCIDGKARPVESGTFPLATGIANRVGLLRGYGNSLTAPVAQAFIEAYLEVEKDNQ